MRTQTRLFRLGATTAIIGLAMGPVLPQPGFAQPAPQAAPPALAPPAASASEPATTADPPARVGRLARIVGAVSFHGLGADHWDSASLNFPVTSGDSFWTQPAASADIGVTGNRLTMDQSTELDVTTLDDQSVVASIPQGQIYLRLAALAPGETYTVATPRGTVAIAAPGRYEISAGDTGAPTRITVLDGAAQVSGDGINLELAANQTGLITGTGPYQTQVVPAQRDAFLTAQLARELPARPPGGVAAPAVVAQMTGGDELAEYGAWQEVPQYGTVWYPQVAAGWVPYRQGHWAYVAPWGWTWVDAAPWGFAPFHYGRWVQVGGRWGWTPGVAVAVGGPGYVRPVYAPALVSFFAVGAAVGVGVALGAAAFHGNVGWCPLGWNEPYHPWYHASQAYMRNVNIRAVRNVTNITTINNTTINTFANRRAATMVPAGAMVASRPVGQLARPIPAADLAQARPVFGREPIRPTSATVGITHREAERMHLQAPPPGMAPANRRTAPGPVIRAQATAPNARPPLAAGHRPEPTHPNEMAPGQQPGQHGPGHAPGPAIPPPGRAAAPNATPALRPPTEAARPGQARPHPGMTLAHPQSVVPERVQQPQAHEPAQRAPAPNAPMPHAPMPQQHPPALQEHRPPKQAPREPAPQHRPEPQPQAMHAPPPVHQMPPPARNAEHAAPPPHPAAHPGGPAQGHPPERPPERPQEKPQQQSHRQGNERRNPNQG